VRVGRINDVTPSSPAVQLNGCRTVVSGSRATIARRNNNHGADSTNIVALRVIIVDTSLNVARHFVISSCLVLVALARSLARRSQFPRVSARPADAAGRSKTSRHGDDTQRGGGEESSAIVVSVIASGPLSVAARLDPVVDAVRDYHIGTIVVTRYHDVTADTVYSPQYNE